MRVLVTGGLGFIGSHVVDQLLVAGGDEVVVLDSLDPAAHAVDARRRSIPAADVRIAAARRRRGARSTR